VPIASVSGTFLVQLFTGNRLAIYAVAGVWAIIGAVAILPVKGVR
jgi:hypothetical protein